MKFEIKKASKKSALLRMALVGLSAQVTRIANVADALRAALVDVAPAIAKRHRVEAEEKREKARALLAEACALEDAAQKIDDALAAMG